MDTLPQFFILTVPFFLVLFVLGAIFSFLALRSEMGNALLGVIRLIAAIIVAPYVYLTKALADLGRFSLRSHDSLGENTHQYLLSVVTHFLQAGLIIVSLCILTGGLVQGCSDAMPPQELRERVTFWDDRVHQQTVQLLEAEAEVKSKDEQWESRKAEITSRDRQERQERAAKAKEQNRSMVAKKLYDMPGGQDVFFLMQDYYQQNKEASNSQAIEKVAADLNTYISSQAIEDTLKKILSQYNENWRSIQLAKLQEDTAVREEQLRREYNLSSSSACARAEQLRGAISESGRSLAQASSLLEYNPKAFFVRVGFAIGLFLVVVWVGGIFIEIVSLGTRLAGDVKSIRDDVTRTRMAVTSREGAFLK